MEQGTHSPTPYRRLVRGNGPIAGVAAGLADYFQVDPVLVRLGLAVSGIVAFPAVPVAYLAAWLIIPKPEEQAAQPPAPMPPPPAPGPVPPAPSPFTEVDDEPEAEALEEAGDENGEEETS